MMVFLYTVMMTAALAVAYPVAWIAALAGRRRLLMRLTPPRKLPSGGSPRVWIHAASVGESGIAYSLAGKLKERIPGAAVFVSTVTGTGLDHIGQMSERSLDSPVDGIFLAPLDHPLVTRMFVRVVRPDVFVLVETELWPWLIDALERRGVPVTVINGRISRRAFRRYSFFRSEVRRMLNGVTLFCVQNRTFAGRFRHLGVPPERIETIGNVKFDNLPDASAFDPEAIRRRLGIPEGVPVFVAGSTRPGEEAVVARAFRSAADKRPELVMVLAPRHLNRQPEVEETLRKAGLAYVKRSAGGTVSPPAVPVLLLDTMGELVGAFAGADAAFVGGSLTDFGGHNPLEPAALGTPVLFGPYMEQTGCKELLEGGAASVVHDDRDLAATLDVLLARGERRNRMAAAGPLVVNRFRGTLARTLDCMIARGILRGDAS